MAQAKWIWFPDDFEIELSAKFMAERYERDVFIPPFWKQYSCYRNVKFTKTVNLSVEENVKIRTEGKFNVMIDGAYLYGITDEFTLPSGKHEIVVSVYNPYGLPCLLLEGKTIISNETWNVTCNDHKYLSAAYDDDLIFGSSTPNTVKLPVKEILPVTSYIENGQKVFDFGKEIFAYIRFDNVSLTENATVYYGESREEVIDTEHCELISQDFEVDGFAAVTKIAKAFRYVTVKGIEFKNITALFENKPVTRSSSFVCNDEKLNKIYEVSAYTLSLNSREFLIDGIKRDRWIWSADAYQSALMQYYSFFDTPVIKRTLSALFGKSPFDLYINHIMDYSFFWIIGFYDYYRFTGDREFVIKNAYKAFEIMEHCLGRRDENGLMDTRAEDWVFVDWADLDNSGEVCYEQLLMAAALRSSVKIAEIIGNAELKDKYSEIFTNTLELLQRFWSEEKGAFVYSIKNGVPDGKILRQPNLMAVLFDLCSEERKESIKNNVLKNPSVTPITTPYMCFYELAALCRTGESEYVLGKITDYWGGMLDEGATTFWESYDSRQKGVEKYAMYGRSYGKSLCHAWGASPLYLIGRYIVGLSPENDGKNFRLAPNYAGLKNFSAEIPVVKGFVKIHATEKSIKVYSSALSGVLVWNNAEYEILPGQEKEVIF